MQIHLKKKKKYKENFSYLVVSQKIRFSSLLLVKGEV